MRVITKKVTKLKQGNKFIHTEVPECICTVVSLTVGLNYTTIKYTKRDAVSGIQWRAQNYTLFLPNSCLLDIV